ncbi:MAG TPA: HDIG domain-containing protein [Syntrophomonas sp.]|nr:HDIG domain-containing protein [Syntrophomonas sp.]
MIEKMEARFDEKVDLNIKIEYRNCISDLTQNEMVRSLEEFTHHRNFTRLQHCLHVSYLSYLVCRKLGLDSQSAARGGLLHDFYFYDSHQVKPDRGNHYFCHPSIALENAARVFTLNEVEKDIIVKHMWPVTMSPPKYRESYVVMMMDKYCAAGEVAEYGSRRTRSQQNLLDLLPQSAVNL